MKKLIIGAVALAVAAIGIGSLATPSAFAAPTNVYVVNLNVATYLNSGTAVTCDAASANTNAANLAAWQTASAGQISSDIAHAGTVCIFIKTDGSTTPVTFNPRGLTIGAVDGPTAGTNGVFAAAPVTAAGTFASGNAVDVIQDSVSLPTGALTLVSQANQFTLTVVKTTIQEGATTCGLTDATTGPTKSAAVATYTDVNGHNLVGYASTWTPLFSTSGGKLGVAGTGVTVSSLLADGTTIAGYTVVCGKAAGTGTVTATAAAGQIAGVSGALQRTQDVVVNGVPASVALTASPAAIPCDGTSTSTVTAKVTDSAGNNVVDGTTVTFNVVALGTANPINATTTGGSATSVITPLSGGTAGTIVNVVSGSAAASIRIDCLPSLATATANAGGGAATPTPRGGVVGPNTGTGGYLGQDSSSSFSMWTLVALALGSVVLVAGGLVTRRAGK